MASRNSFFRLPCFMSFVATTFFTMLHERNPSAHRSEREDKSTKEEEDVLGISFVVELDLQPVEQRLLLWRLQQHQQHNK